MSLLASLLVLAVATGLGSRLGGRLWQTDDDLLYRYTLAALAGLTALYAGMLVLEFTGLGWSGPALAGVVLVILLVFSLLGRGASAPPVLRETWPGWGEWIALTALAALAVCAAKSWATNPDFIFHWGIKGARFAHTGGIDEAFLAKPWGWMRHPDYPWLLPSLFALSAKLRGTFRESGMQLWSAIVFAFTLASARTGLRLAGASRFVSQATLAVIALCCAGFGIGFLVVGGPDWHLALAPLAAWPAFLRRGTLQSDLTVGVAAAFAAGSKIEGMPLAALMLALYWLPSPAERRWRALPALLLPSALVVGPWAWLCWRHGLLSDEHLVRPRLDYLSTIARAGWETLGAPEWHGAALALLLLPLLFRIRKARPLAAIVSLQLSLYFLIYLSAPVKSAAEMDFYVRSNLARLAFHLMPALLAGAGMLLGRISREP